VAVLYRGTSWVDSLGGSSIAQQSLRWPRMGVVAQPSDRIWTSSCQASDSVAIEAVVLARWPSRADANILEMLVNLSQ